MSRSVWWKVGREEDGVVLLSCRQHYMCYRHRRYCRRLQNGWLVLQSEYARADGSSLKQEHSTVSQAWRWEGLCG